MRERRELCYESCQKRLTKPFWLKIEVRLGVLFSHRSEHVDGYGVPVVFVGAVGFVLGGVEWSGSGTKLAHRLG